jgi:hypothetical protein
MRNMRVGIDFDNTIACYDNSFTLAARSRGISLPGTSVDKLALRDYLRSQPGGEIEWQRVQAEVYGRRMSQACVFSDFPHFVERCRSHSISLVIVSHKTEFAAQDQTVNLRDAAMAWMVGQGFLGNAGLGFAEEDVFFAGTRREKVETISKLGCSCFIDDLQEVFADEGFPQSVTKILFDPAGLAADTDGIQRCSSWAQVMDIVFAFPGLRK